MTIAYYLHSISNGGAEKVASKLTQIWSDLGHQVVLLTQNPKGDKEYPHQCVARACVPYGEMTQERAAELQKRFGFDVLVFNDSLGDADFPNVFSAFRALPDLKIGVIVHHTSNNWLYTTGNTQELFMDELLRQADAMICVDKMWALWWHHRGVRSFYIPNPVSVGEGVRGQELGIPTNRSLVWIGRIMDWAKQPEKMVDAFAEVLKQVPDAKLYMLGSKTPEAERKLRKRFGVRCRESGVRADAACLSFPGFVTNAADYMRQAALHVFTSLTEVAVPQVILEAQALGLPTLALDMPVLRGVSGVAIADDESDFASRIVRHLTGESPIPMVDSESHADSFDIVCAWKNFFAAMEIGSLDTLADSTRTQWQSIEEYGILLDELHRSQRYFVFEYLPDYVKLRRLKIRLNPAFLCRRIWQQFLNGARR